MVPKKGDRVRIKKGAVLRSTSPSKDGPYEAGRTYTITVDHVLEGSAILLGWQHEDGKVRLEGTHWRTLFRYLDGLLGGLSYNDFWGGYKQDHAALLDRIKTELGDRFYERGADLYLRVVDTKIRWAGSGGYWVEASANEVEKLDG
tara:strand:+ start:1913 stop:2350 length:438 start_codon:yes stop_codon:yes gene_type:complete